MTMSAALAVNATVQQSAAPSGAVAVVPLIDAPVFVHDA
jgi:hypothetical protein